MRQFFTRLADYIDGWKVHLCNVGTFVFVVVHDWGKWDASSFVVMGFTAASSFCRLLAWRPGVLSGAITLEQADGGTLVVKPPPIPSLS